MSNSNTCNCCEGLTTETPGVVTNRPGLNAVAYRVGTQPLFKESMLAQLSTSKQPALYPLTTRNNDDFSIALLDAWAMVADILTFYQERIANESYLKTATERMSVLELARLIGYEFQPGLAAGTYLSFIINSSLPVPGQAAIARMPVVQVNTGTKVQSVPAPGEQAQTFETVEDIEARVEWNAILPRLTRKQVLGTDSNTILLSGIAAVLNPGDTILIKSSAASKIRKILSVTPDPKANTTLVTLSPQSPAGNDVGTIAATSVGIGKINTFPANTALTETVIKKIIASIWTAEDLLTVVGMQKWSMNDLALGIANVLAQPSANDTQVFVMRQRAFVFGYNAPLQVTYAKKHPNPPSAWQEWELKETTSTIYLDTAYDKILPGSFIAIQQPGNAIESAAVAQVKQANVASRSDYGLSAKTTALTLASALQWWTPDSNSPALINVIRQITVYAQSEQLTLADVPITDAIGGNHVTLGAFLPELSVGQNAILAGNRDDLPGTVASELITLKKVTIEQGLTRLVFVNSLAYSYTINSVTINANVAKATHGESVLETLGSGDATQVFQQFTLKQPPLTYTSSESASGVTTTLEIRVNDLLWKEVPYFYLHGPDEKIYITRMDDAGNTTVIFGDGITGSRLPSGISNIKATYRKGIGLDGLVGANQLTQMLNAPAGVKSVNNPIAANNAADPETIKDARGNATLPIMTLDRVVSLKDYEDFSRAFAGIGKALATWTWSAQKRCVFLTVAGVNGALIDANGTKNLKSAIWDAGDPDVPLTVVSFQPKFFVIEGNLILDPIYLPADVIADVEAALLDNFSFSKRSFGQSVAYSEVVAVIQDIKGVVAADLTAFRLSTDPVATPVQQRLDANVPIPGANSASPAELLTIDAGSLKFNVIPS